MGVSKMTSERSVSEPPRLVLERDNVSVLLRQSEQAFRADLAEGPAWHRFQQKTQRKRWVLWLAPAMASVAIAVALAAAHFRRPPAAEFAALSVTAEPIMTAEPIAMPEPVSSASESEHTADRRIPSPVAARVATPIGRIAARPMPTSVDDATCRRWAHEGKAEQAVRCFEMLSQGAGLGAEVALYQAARLSGDGLRDPRHALALLDQHQQRFPNSALRGEVEWLRVQTLERVGELDEALSASDALLATPSGRSLASKLHLLRGHIYAKARSDCAHAVREFVELLGEPGADGDDAELERAQCLEKLARPSEARAAYEHYLQRSDARQAPLAEQRRLMLGSQPAAEAQPE